MKTQRGLPFLPSRLAAHHRGMYHWYHPASHVFTSSSPVQYHIHGHDLCQLFYHLCLWNESKWPAWNRAGFLRVPEYPWSRTSFSCLSQKSLTTWRSAIFEKWARVTEPTYWMSLLEDGNIVKPCIERSWTMYMVTKYRWLVGWRCEWFMIDGKDSHTLILHQHSVLLPLIQAPSANVSAETYWKFLDSLV